MKLASVLFLSVVIISLVTYKVWASTNARTKTVSDVIKTYGELAKNELLPLFKKNAINYPPKNIALIAFKDSKKLELWASNSDVNYSLITTYDIKAASGILGPKLREGDRQVPEGIYKIIGFNPNSAYHLSMKLNYPNSFDLRHAKAEGRNEPGTNIFMHGRAVSIGCLAMGDDVIEDLFSLVYATGRRNTKVIISPTDPSLGNLVVPLDAPSWTNELYENIEKQYSSVTKNITSGVCKTNC